MKVLKIIGHLIFITIFLLVAFFGIGPVAMADGTTKERIITLIIVILIYFLWAWAYRIFIRKTR